MICNVCWGKPKTYNLNVISILVEKIYLSEIHIDDYHLSNLVYLFSGMSYIYSPFIHVLPIFKVMLTSPIYSLYLSPVLVFPLSSYFLYHLFGNFLYKKCFYFLLDLLAQLACWILKDKYCDFYICYSVAPSIRPSTEYIQELNYLL